MLDPVLENLVLACVFDVLVFHIFVFDIGLRKRFDKCACCKKVNELGIKGVMNYLPKERFAILDSFRFC